MVVGRRFWPRSVLLSLGSVSLLFAGAACASHRHHDRDRERPGDRDGTRMNGPPPRAAHSSGAPMAMAPGHGSPNQGSPNHGAPGPMAPNQGAPAPEPAAGPEKLAELSQQVELAQRKVKRASIDAERQRIENGGALEKVARELELAKKALGHFEAVELPQRLARAALDLQEAQDGLAEQDEEMKQLALMYAADDLADKTKEIVLARGRRRFERAKQRLDLARKEHDDLTGVQLPEQRDRLRVAVNEKELDVQRAKLTAATAEMDKGTAQLEAEMALAKAEGEVRKAKRDTAGAPPSARGGAR